MKRYKVIIEEAAEKDLNNIVLYIAETLYEPITAQRILFAIREKIMALCDMPLRYSLVKEESYASLGVRKMPIENYTAFYLVDEERREVHVFRILHNRREWQNLI